MPAEPAVIAVDARFHGHYTSLWAALERVFPVQFVADAPPTQAIGAIVFDNESTIDRAGPSLTLPLPDDSSAHGGIRVQTSALVPDPTLAAMDLTDAGEGMVPLRPHPGEAILAETDVGPVWVMTTDPDIGPAFRSARPLPHLSADAALRDHLTLGDFLGLVPLVQAIRSWLGPSGWSEPPLRATFLFDDINLHGRRYGFIPFETLADDGAEHGYHTIMATIPLDAWFTHPTARRQFGRDDVLSSNTMWCCVSCYFCTTRCPQQIPITDIMYALMKYAEVTGDTKFLHQEGAEMLVETARMWRSLALSSAMGWPLESSTKKVSRLMPSAPL